MLLGGQAQYPRALETSLEVATKALPNAADLWSGGSYRPGRC